MRFILNKTVRFDEEQGTLEDASQQEMSKTLSLTEIRLIGFFVANPNVVISRETLLIEVWEKHDLTPSLNNLNNYMSMVRRKLALLGLPDVIITVPRSGFCFKIDTLEIVESIDEEIALTADSSNNDDEHFIQTESYAKTDVVLKRSHFDRKTTLALLLFLVSLAIAGYLKYSHINNAGSLVKNDLTFYKKINNSDVYFLQGSLVDVEVGSVEESAIIKKIANSKYKNPTVYVYLNKRLTNKSEHSNFIYSLCGNHKNEQCETTYIYNSKDI